MIRRHFHSVIVDLRTAVDVAGPVAAASLADRGGYSVWIWGTTNSAIARIDADGRPEVIVGLSGASTTPRRPSSSPRRPTTSSAKAHAGRRASIRRTCARW